ncbi:sugar phosphate isomerase/epimerase family protein [Natronosalvus rutilus]|uniref:Sugar phosphate isomerase/epimerase n=1 Tax=Natronosalvus rutilus TaxID=2953753 RepID=A0A9E7N8M1_9EURY|nr:sugar phosphate isomerase/epimerase [Natronosalvus rutilus]UTF53717.1 sugar phosphate isomerase/epimerase [Natronosalvus rutilus]
MHTAVQLYSLRRLDRSLSEKLELVARTGLEGVELAGLGDADPTAIGEVLERTALEAMAAHVSVADLEADLEAAVRPSETVGCERIVVPWLDADSFRSRRVVEETAQRLATLGERLADEGYSCSYHNHTQEFFAIESDVDDQRDAFDVLADALAKTPVTLELDVGWAHAAGRDPVSLLERYGEQIPLVHLKDVDGDEPCALGAGSVPLEACVDAAREVGVEWLVYEHDDPSDPERALERDAETMVDLLGR